MPHLSLVAGSFILVRFHRGNELMPFWFSEWSQFFRVLCGLITIHLSNPRISFALLLLQICRFTAQWGGHYRAHWVFYWIYIAKSHVRRWHSITWTCLWIKNVITLRFTRNGDYLLWVCRKFDQIVSTSGIEWLVIILLDFVVDWINIGSIVCRYWKGSGSVCLI